MLNSDKRGKTLKERRAWFKHEQAECLSRLREMTVAVVNGDVYEIKCMQDLVNTSVRYLEANDPRRK